MARAQFVSETHPTHQTPDFWLAVRKFGLSFLLILSFTAYAIRARLLGNSATLPPDSQSAPSDAANPASGSQSAATQPTAVANNHYKDGQYAGNVTNAFFGNVQVKVIIQAGKITDIQWLEYPHDRRTSQEINAQATPWLKTEAIQAQSAQVDIISGATLTSEAFIQSLGSALNQAQG